jgi:hypothetical protein
MARTGFVHWLMALAGGLVAVTSCHSSSGSGMPGGDAGAVDAGGGGGKDGGGDAAAGTGGAGPATGGAGPATGGAGGANPATGGTGGSGSGGAGGAGGSASGGAGGGGGSGSGGAGGAGDGGGKLDVQADACNANCTPGTCAGTFTIRSNAEFAAFVAMACREVTGNLRIAQTELTSLDGLVIERVGQELIIGANSMLTSLKGLERVTRVGASLSIVQNVKLTSLAPLGSWPAGAVGGGIAIFNNEALPQCEVDRLDAHLTANCSNCANNGTGTCP